MGTIISTIGTFFPRIHHGNIFDNVTRCVPIQLYMLAIIIGVMPISDLQSNNYLLYGYGIEPIYDERDEILEIQLFQTMGSMHSLINCKEDESVSICHVGPILITWMTFLFIGDNDQLKSQLGYILKAHIPILDDMPLEKYDNFLDFVLMLCRNTLRRICDCVIISMDVDIIDSDGNIELAIQQALAAGHVLPDIDIPLLIAKYRTRNVQSRSRSDASKYLLDSLSDILLLKITLLFMNHLEIVQRGRIVVMRSFVSSYHDDPFLNMITFQSDDESDPYQMLSLLHDIKTQRMGLLLFACAARAHHPKSKLAYLLTKICTNKDGFSRHLRIIMKFLDF